MVVTPVMLNAKKHKMEKKAVTWWQLFSCAKFIFLLTIR